MSGLKEQVIETVVNNPKTQMLVATSTVSVAAGGQTIEFLQNIFGLIGVVLGCVLTLILIVKNFKEMK
jgi:hypothetical protein|tara:strand:- start:12656 stop:12859 length:204 start_codon:yes stop_codon:yes gene_type:complete